jgi:putative ABC transport system ATP-binding protein/macrolide transport system ATP-binding/permease protein/lipoprotein-releasing system ATP-binding protein
MRTGSIIEETSPAASSVPRLSPSVTQPSSLQPEPATAPSQLGEGLVRFLGSCAAWGFLVLALLLAVNQGLAFYQQQRIDGRAAAHAALEELAMSGLRADIADITPEGEDEFLLKLYLWNVTDGKPLFVLAPDVRAFVQVGSGWTEVPLDSSDGLKGRVLQIDGKQFYTFRFRPDVANFEELLPGYLHVRFTNQMLISPRSEPADDLVERSDSYYVYLKPRRADDQELLKKLKFPGKPPVWIPMPPH